MKRQRIDTVAGAVATAAGVMRELSPPADIQMRDVDWLNWDSVVAEFPKAEWTDHQLRVAAQLAKAMADAEIERNSLQTEGYVLDIGGKPVVNPRHGVARDLGNTCMAWRRNLSLHARAKGGEARDVGKRRDQAKAIEAGLMVDDDFIGRPSVN